MMFLPLTDQDIYVTLEDIEGYKEKIKEIFTELGEEIKKN